MYMKIRTSILWLLFLIGAYVCQPASSAERIQLVKDGSTDYRIMLGPGASPVVEFATQELQGYVMQISNAFLPMASRNEPARGKLVLVGDSAAAKLGLDIANTHLGKDGFIIKTIDDKIVLAGGGPRGTLYSVYVFLEMLGCRWLAPGILGEVVPRYPNIVVESIDHSERPDIVYRGFTNLVPVSYEGSLWIDWMAKNKMNYFMISQPNYDDFMEILGGELEQRGMDIGVRLDNSMSVDQVQEFIGNRREISLIEIDTEYMETEEADKESLEYATMISDMINKYYPGKLAFLMEPSKTSTRCYRHHLGDEECEINREVKRDLESQLRTRNKLHIHEFYMGPYGQNSLPFPILHTIAWDLGYFNELQGLEGVISQCEPGNWGAYGLNYYVFARMAWNAHNDLGQIVDDYCERYYGPASSPMKEYFATLEDAMTATEHFRYVDPPQSILELLDESSLAKMGREIQKATELASDAMTFDRLRKTELSLNHAELLWTMLNHYSMGIKFQEAEESDKAIVHFQQTAHLGEKLVAFLFQNIEEDVYIIPEGYIFDYLEPLIADARERKDLLEVE